MKSDTTVRVCRFIKKQPFHKMEKRQKGCCVSSFLLFASVICTLQPQSHLSIFENLGCQVSTPEDVSLENLHFNMLPSGADAAGPGKTL